MSAAALVVGPVLLDMEPANKVAAQAATPSKSASSAADKTPESTPATPAKSSAPAPAPAKKPAKSPAAKAPIKPAAAKPAVKQASTAKAGPSEKGGVFSGTAAKISGLVSLRGRSRSSKNDSDGELETYTRLGVTGLWDDHVSLRASGRILGDVWGNERLSRNKADLFRGLDDTFKSRAHGNLYTAQAEVNAWPTSGLSAIGGRQYLTTDRSYHFDGLSAKYKGDGFSASLFGGVPVLYATSARGGYWLAGAHGDYKPYRNAKLALDYSHTRDRERLTAGTNHADYASATLWHRFFEDYNLFARTSYLQRRMKDVRVRATAEIPGSGTEIRGWYYRLLKPQDDRGVLYAPLTGVLGRQEAYQQGGLSVRQPVGDFLDVEVGGEVRRLVSTRRESKFNHEYERGYALVTATGWPVEGLDATVGVDYWHTPDYRAVDGTRSADNSQAGADGSVGYEFLDGAVRVESGVDYAFWKELELLSSGSLLNVEDEREDVWTFFGDVRLRSPEDWPTGGALLRARYEHETGDAGVINTIDVRLEYEF